MSHKKGGGGQNFEGSFDITSLLEIFSLFILVGGLLEYSLFV